MANQPTFNTKEELDAYLDSLTESTTKQSKPSNANSKRSPKRGKSTSTKTRSPIPKKLQDSAASIRPDIQSAIHFYIPVGISSGVVQYQAREERRFRNDNVLVFCHSHSFGEACGANCCELKGDN